jgi:hypothetical protein
MRLSADKRNKSISARNPRRLDYESTEPGPGGNDPLLLTPLKLLDRLAALVPPPRTYGHGHFGVLAPTAAHWKFRGDTDRQLVAVQRSRRSSAPRAPHQVPNLGTTFPERRGDSAGDYRVLGAADDTSPAVSARDGLVLRILHNSPTPSLPDIGATPLTTAAIFTLVRRLTIPPCSPCHSILLGESDAALSWDKQVTNESTRLRRCESDEWRRHTTPIAGNPAGICRVAA